jgi:hypothetical protein
MLRPGSRSAPNHRFTTGCLAQTGRGCDRPCRARPADPVPSRGGLERRRRPRPNGTGKALGPCWVRNGQANGGQQRA